MEERKPDMLVETDTLAWARPLTALVAETIDEDDDAARPESLPLR
jgi:hypothetical protein